MSEACGCQKPEILESESGDAYCKKCGRWFYGDFQKFIDNEVKTNRRENEFKELSHAGSERRSGEVGEAGQVHEGKEAPADAGGKPKKESPKEMTQCPNCTGYLGTFSNFWKEWRECIRCGYRA